MKKTIGGTLFAIAVVIVVVVFFRHILHGAQDAFGFRAGDGNSPSYLFWSGAGSDLAYLSIVAGAVIYYRKENCKKRWCPFLGHYEFTDKDGIVRKLCWVHHPDVHHKTLTREHITKIKKFQAEHPLFYLGDKPGKG